MGYIKDSEIQCIDPRTGEPAGTVPCTPTDAVASAMERTREAQRAWWERDLRARKDAVRALHQGFLEAAPKIAASLLRECGRPAGEAWTAEIVANHELFAWWLKNIDDLLAHTPVDLNPINYPGKRGHVRLDPLGVIGLITPWNLPVAIPLRTIIPAVLSGNGVTWKPSEHTPHTSTLLTELFDQHLGKDLVTCIMGAKAQGEAMIDACPDAIFFTGSVAGGRAVQQHAASRGTPASVELGGKDAAVVLHDADLERAAKGITWAAFGFAGQNCAAVERCFVHRSIYDSFVERVVQEARRLQPMKDIGPLVTKEQLEKVKRHCKQALDEGASVLCGGEPTGPGYYFPPTVLVNVSEDALVMTDETFGPLLPIVPFEQLDELPAKVNGTAFGLTTSVWTQDTDFGEAIAEQFSCGVITINNHSFTGALASAAWGGTGDTGHGVTNSRFSLYGMTRPKTVVIDRSKQSEMWWYPYNRALLDVTSGLVELSRSGGNRLPALGQVISGLTRRWKEES